MGDYIRRLLIAAIMLLFVSLLFFGGKHSKAETLSINEATKEWIWPSDGIVTDTFNTRHGSHKGIDIAGELGSEIQVVDDGVVTKSYYSNSYGHVIFVKHEKDLETVYAHLNKRFVSEGQKVKKGDLIGAMGNTGYSSGVHLHFEIHKKEWTVTKENAMDPFVVYGEMEVGQKIDLTERKLEEPEDKGRKDEQSEEEKNKAEIEEEIQTFSVLEISDEYIETEATEVKNNHPYKQTMLYIKEEKALKQLEKEKKKAKKRKGTEHVYMNAKKEVNSLIEERFPPIFQYQ